MGIAAVGGLVIAEWLTRVITGSPNHYSFHVFPRLGGAVLAALLASGAVCLLEKKNPPRVVIDKGTGRELVLRRSDALFFIPAQNLPYVILAIGVLAAFAWLNPWSARFQTAG